MEIKLYDPNYCKKPRLFLFQSTSSLLIQCITRLTHCPVQAQVNLPSSLLLFMTSPGFLLGVFSWDSFCGTVGENCPSPIWECAGSWCEHWAHWCYWNSDLGIPCDFGSVSVWISLLASDASELFPWAWSVEKWRRGFMYIWITWSMALGSRNCWQ